ncbi:MAG TPA: PhzF family phenazine biosynthesis protein [Steroidobacteraceae bacterium]|nr:PhzF family phenazine biosynthesis protein [Steroidobacteraceae bacterium]
MSILSYHIVNVFTRGGDLFSGNPLCVIEDGRGLDTQQMQSLARQFNLSETSFILPSQRASARVRIFTPTFEMPFAGHPTLGTAHVCRILGLGGDALTLEMQAGIIPVQAQGRSWTLEANAPTWREVEPPTLVAHLLGLGPGDIAGRPMWVNAGKEQLVIPLVDAQAVRRASMRPEVLRNFASQDGINMAYVFAPEGPGRFVARFFFGAAGSGVLEDPATGSAAANFGGWWLAMDRPVPAAMEIFQGEQVQRPSTLHVHIDAGRRIFVSGEVLEIGRGTVSL